MRVIGLVLNNRNLSGYLNVFPPTAKLPKVGRKWHFSAERQIFVKMDQFFVFHMPSKFCYYQIALDEKQGGPSFFPFLLFLKVT